jgi:hypothetical protein
LAPVPNPPETNARTWKRPAELPEPVAHWNFDEADHTKFIDVTGTIPDGRAGGLRRSAGIIGKAMTLDGSEPFVPLGPGGQPKMVFRSQMTLAAWVRPNAGTSGQVTRRNAGYKLSWNGREIQFELVLAGPGQNAHFPLSAQASADRWAHVVGVFDGDRVSLFLDGRLAQSKLVSEDPQAKTDRNLKSRKPPYVMFGVDPGTPNDVGGGYKGMADELMLFDTALTPEQIETLAASYRGDAGNDLK